MKQIQHKLPLAGKLLYLMGNSTFTVGNPNFLPTRLPKITFPEILPKDILHKIHRQILHPLFFVKDLD